MSLPGRIAFGTLRLLERCSSPSLLASALSGFSAAANRFIPEPLAPASEKFESLFRISDAFPIPTAKQIATLSFHTGPLEWEVLLAESWNPDETPPDSERGALLHTVNSLLPTLEKHPEQIRGEILDCIVGRDLKDGGPS